MGFLNIMFLFVTCSLYPTKFFCVVMLILSKITNHEEIIKPLSIYYLMAPGCYLTSNSFKIYVYMFIIRVTIHISLLHYFLLRHSGN